MRATPLLLLTAMIGGCAPETGDALVDRVASTVAPFSPCLIVGETSISMAGGEMGPPGLLTPQSFKRRDASEAASKIAKPWQVRTKALSRFFGKGSAETCLTNVDAPALSGNFAFVFFSEPGGNRGAFAFRKQGSQWLMVEKVQLGYW